MTVERTRLFIWVMFYIFSLLCIVEGKVCVDIVVSAPIRPYLEIAEEIQNSKLYDSEVYILSDQTGRHLKKVLCKSPCEFAVAVGYDAFRFLGENVYCGKKKLFSMVLYPEFNQCYRNYLCGISLNLPSGYIARVVRSFGLKRAVIVYHSLEIRNYIEIICKSLEKNGFKVVPVRVSSVGDLYKLADDKNVKILIFIPDDIFVYREILKRIIPVMVLRGKVVIGFNKVFLKYGASAIFQINCAETGKKMRKLVENLIKTGLCNYEDPVYDILMR